MQKFTAINQLRTDIREILGQKDISQENLRAAKIKIDTLQDKNDRIRKGSHDSE
jgi:hypothetical protein